MDDVIYIDPKDIELLNPSDYVNHPSDFFGKLPEVAKPLVKDASVLLSKIEKMIYSTPSIINAIKAAKPEVTLQAILTGKEKQQIAKGALEVLTKKDGTLMATLIDAKTKKIVANVPLKSIKVTPELANAMTNFTSQMQLAQIAEQIQSVQIAIEDVRKGQENDRLAIAYSCQQKLLQAREIKNPELRSRILLQVVSDAEDSRNLLMLSQEANISFIKDQPESTFEKIFRGEKSSKIDSRMNEIRDGVNAVNMVSLSQAIAYYELGEPEAAIKSLTYFADFIDRAYLSTPGLIERLDSIDPSPKNYWSNNIPSIEKKLMSLPSVYSKLEEVKEN